VARYELVTAPTSEPVTVAQMRAQIRQDAAIMIDDTLVTSLIVSCTRLVEDYIGYRLMTQTWRQWLDDDEVDYVISLGYPLAPLQSVSSVKFYDEDDSATTATASTYYTLTQSRTSKVALKSSNTWPTVTNGREFNFCAVEAVVGFGSDRDAISEAEFFIAQGAIKSLVYYLYASRGNFDSQRLVIPGAVNVAIIPPEIKAQLDPIKPWRLY